MFIDVYCLYFCTGFEVFTVVDMKNPCFEDIITCSSLKTMLDESLVTMAWHVLRWQIKEMTSSYEG
jgi:hypothetical protein